MRPGGHGAAGCGVPRHRSHVAVGPVTAPDEGPDRNVLDERQDVLKINESLIQFEDGKPFVEVLTGPDAYERVDVELGLSDGLESEVLSGLKGEEAIKKWNQPQYEGHGVD